ncbi:hypothetical protein N9A78_00575 [Akkermansiaceae bacterium]|nr:hypothetical protein [Akkermansiaceae bacterium]
MKVAILLIFGLSSLMNAEMVFKTKLVEITAKPDVTEITVEFPFEIMGSAAEIIEYEAPCTCLTARVEPLNPDRSTKLRWDIGENGRIFGRFKMGNFKGTVDKAIVLKMKGVDKPIQLVVRVTIPILFEIQPSTLKWEIGETPTEKTFKIKVNHDQPIKLIENSGTSGNFPYEVKTIREGWEYEIKVKPSSTEKPGMGMIRLKTDCAIKRHERHQVFVVVKKERK